MNALPSTAEEAVPPRTVSPWLVAGGIVFILAWGALVVLLISLSLMGTLMANDGGETSSDRHSLLVVGVLASQIVLGLAGIPAGLAFFWRGRRGVLLAFFAALLLLGVLGQASAFMYWMPG